MSARKSERLLNLLITLLVARGYVDKQRLREVIPDYRAATTQDAFEKMFERDKEDLRALGVPIETGGHDPLFDDEQGYRIPREAFELPEIELQADEAAVIGLAARVWQQAGLAAATSDALLKLKAAGVEVDRSALDVAQPQVTPDEPAFETFFDAVATRRPVRFDYRSGTSAQVTARRLHPWAVVSYQSRWYAVGQDLDRDDHRMFRLSRVVGDVRYAGPPGSFSVPEGTDLRGLTTRLAPDVPQRTAEIRVRRGKALGLRRRATAVRPGQVGWELLDVGFGRLDALADELLGYRDDVVAESPPELRNAILDRLEAVLAGGAR